MHLDHPKQPQLAQLSRSQTLLPRTRVSPIIVSNVLLKSHSSQTDGFEDIQVLLPEAAPTYDIFNVSRTKDLFFLLLLEEKDFYYVGMAMLGIKLGDRVGSESSYQMNHAYDLMGRGLSALRERIGQENQQADDITIMTTAYLMEIASLPDDPEAYQIHLNSLEEMLSSRGGLENLGFDGAVRCTLL